MYNHRLCTLLCSLQEGWTSLMFASQFGHFECLKELLDRGAEVNLKNMVSQSLQIQVYFGSERESYTQTGGS